MSRRTGPGGLNFQDFRLQVHLLWVFFRVFIIEIRLFEVVLAQCMRSKTVHVSGYPSLPVARDAGHRFDVDWEDGDVTERFPGRQLRKPSAVKYKVGEDVEVRAAEAPVHTTPPKRSRNIHFATAEYRVQDP